MKPSQENIDGKLVETHEFAHSVEHQINWSHVLAALVLLVAIYKLGPAISAAAGPADREERR